MSDDRDRTIPPTALTAVELRLSRAAQTNAECEAAVARLTRGTAAMALRAGLGDPDSVERISREMGGQYVEHGEQLADAIRELGAERAWLSFIARAAPAAAERRRLAIVDRIARLRAWRADGAPDHDEHDSARYERYWASRWRTDAVPAEERELWASYWNEHPEGLQQDEG